MNNQTYTFTEFARKILTDVPQGYIPDLIGRITFLKDIKKQENDKLKQANPFRRTARKLFHAVMHFIFHKQHNLMEAYQILLNKALVPQFQDFQGSYWGGVSAQGKPLPDIKINNTVYITSGNWTTAHDHEVIAIQEETTSNDPNKVINLKKRKLTIGHSSHSPSVSLWFENRPVTYLSIEQINTFTPYLTALCERRKQRLSEPPPISTELSHANPSQILIPALCPGQLHEEFS